MTIPGRILATYDPAVRARLEAAGFVHQGILHVSRHDHDRAMASSQSSDSKVGSSVLRAPEPIRLRTLFEIELVTSVCPICPSLVNGRCASLKGCGCNRKPSDWARLSSHHCPKKKW